VRQFSTRGIASVFDEGNTGRAAICACGEV